MAWPRTLPDEQNPPRPSGEIPQLEVPGLKIVQSYQPGQTFGRTATANAQPFSAIVSHYTGGESLQGALSTAKGDSARGGTPYGYHFVIDKDGTVYQTAPLDARTNHVMPPGSSQRTDRPDISNNNAMGISFVGSSDKPTPQQLASAQKLYPAVQQRFNISSDNIVGHGQIQSSRQKDEGMTITNAVRTGAPATQTAQATPAPGKPLGDTMASPTPSQAFSPTPVSAVAGSSGQQAISTATSTSKDAYAPRPAAAPASTPLGNTAAQSVTPPTQIVAGPQTFYDVPPRPYMPVEGGGAVPVPPNRTPQTYAASGPRVTAKDVRGGESSGQASPSQGGVATPAPAQRAPAPAAAPQQAQAPAQAPARAPARPAPAAAPAGKGLGNQMPVAGGYVDPSTGHQIINPSGSGETAMGVTRDIGPAPARQAPAPAPARAAPPPGRGTPKGPVPRAPEAAATLAAPEQTLKALDASKAKGNTLTDLYKGGNLPVGQQQPPATFKDIANAPPAVGFGSDQKGTTLTDLPLPPYNVGGPGGTPLPPARPSPGQNLGQPSGLISAIDSLIPPGFGSRRTGATPAEQAQIEQARGNEQRYADAQPGGGVPGATTATANAAPPARNFLRPGVAATPAEQAQQSSNQAAEALYGNGIPAQGAENFRVPDVQPHSSLIKAIQDAVAGGYRPGFLNPLGPAATPQEQVQRNSAPPFVPPGANVSMPVPPPGTGMSPSAISAPGPGPQPGPQPQSMLPPWQQQPPLPLSPFNTGLPGQGWPDWQNVNSGFSGNFNDFGGGGFAGGGEGFAYTPG